MAAREIDNTALTTGVSHPVHVEIIYRVRKMGSGREKEIIPIANLRQYYIASNIHKNYKGGMSCQNQVLSDRYERQRVEEKKKLTP